MSLPQILIVDDQYPRDTGARQTFTSATGLLDLENPQNENVRPQAAASFCSGQRQEKDAIVNDYPVIEKTVAAGPPSGDEWALVLLDVCFDSGPLSEFGLPEGRPGDDHFGEEVRKRLAADFSALPVVMLSSKKQHELIDRETPYLSKTGLKPRDLAIILLRYGRLTRDQQRNLLALPEEVVAEDPSGFSLFREAFAIAGNDISVLILGETGTGKEVLARYIHERSGRADRPFVPVNVAALPAELVESELFGHEKGAFTGADRKRQGRFAQAHGGTLFLDEIGDMPPPLQAKVLRVLQDGEVLPVGGTEPVRVNVRIVAATSRDLGSMQQAGNFREDLTRRISGATLTIPPLRERKDDIIPLAGFFLERYSATDHKEGISFADEALALLKMHPFHGNIGELRHIVQGLVNRKGNHSIISATDVKEALAGSFVSLAATAERKEETLPASAGGHDLTELVRLIESCTISKDDPFLKGGKPRLQQAVQNLLQKMAGASLERFRDPRNGQLNRQAAMQWLSGDGTLTGKGPGRVINEILGRRADTAITDDDLEQLIGSWSGKKEAERE